MKGEKFPDCEQGRANCQSYCEGTCRILTNTHFKRLCQFFKARKWEDDEE